MSISTPTLITFLIYIAAMILIGFVAYRATKNFDDYILGGRSLGSFVTALSAGASDMSGWLLMGLPGAIFVAGLSESWIAIGLIVGAWLNWLFVAGRLRVHTEHNHNALTLPDYFSHRFEDESRMLRIFSALVILVFFTIYYRMFGLITSLAMLFNLLIVVAVMSLFGATMTLPGFAGLALSVGLSVDANVLINERIREELRAGVPGKTAIVTGYERASGTILDANLTGLIVGVALFAFGTGPLKGFALTMIIGIFASMFTAITVSRALATLIYGRRKKLQNVAI